MPLGANTVHEAKSNLFISSLFHYREQLAIIVQIEEAIKNEHHGDVALLIQHCRLAFTHFHEAMNIALEKAERQFLHGATSQERDEQCDFADWLMAVEREDWIFKELIGLISHFQDQGLVNEAFVLNYSIDGWRIRIRALREISINKVQQSTFNEPLARGELDHIFQVLKKNPSRTNVSNNYLSHFSSFLKQLLNHPDALKKHKECPNWLNNHYNEAQTFLTSSDQSVITHFQMAWEKFQLEFKRPTDLIAYVEKSIELYFMWERMSLIQKLVESFKAQINELRERIQRAIASLPSVGTRVGQYLLEMFGGAFGIIFSPIILPTLWIAGQFSTKGSNAFDWYLNQTIRNKQAWIGLAFLGVATVGIVVPIIHPVIASVWALAPALSITTIVGGGTLLLANAQHKEEVERLEGERDKAVKTLQDQESMSKVEIDAEMKKRQAVLDSIKEDKDSEEYTEYTKAARKFSDHRIKKTYSKKTTNFQSTGDDDVPSSHQNTVRPDVLNTIFDSMSREELSEAEREHAETLKKAEEEIVNLNLQQADLERKTQEIGGAVRRYHDEIRRFLSSDRQSILVSSSSSSSFELLKQEESSSSISSSSSSGSSFNSSLSSSKQDDDRKEPLDDTEYKANSSKEENEDEVGFQMITMKKPTSSGYLALQSSSQFVSSSSSSSSLFHADCREDKKIEENEDGDLQRTIKLSLRGNK